MPHRGRKDFKTTFSQRSFQSPLSLARPLMILHNILFRFGALFFNILVLVKRNSSDFLLPQSCSTWNHQTQWRILPQSVRVRQLVPLNRKLAERSSRFSSGTCFSPNLCLISMDLRTPSQTGAVAVLENIGKAVVVSDFFILGPVLSAWSLPILVPPTEPPEEEGSARGISD